MNIIGRKVCETTGGRKMNIIIVVFIGIVLAMLLGIVIVDKVEECKRMKSEDYEYYEPIVVTIRRF